MIDYYTVFTALLLESIKEMLEQTEVDNAMILHQPQKAEKLIRRHISDNVLEVVSIVELYRDSMKYLTQIATKAEALSAAKRADQIFARILDIDGYYIQLIVALYIGMNVEKSGLQNNLIQRKAERLYNDVIDVLGKKYDRETIRSSIKVGEVIVAYLKEGKQIPFSIKSQKAHWRKK